LKEGELFVLEIELSFPPDRLLGRSTHTLRSLAPAPWEVAERLQKYFEHHSIPTKVLKA